MHFIQIALFSILQVVLGDYTAPYWPPKFTVIRNLNLIVGSNSTILSSAPSVAGPRSEVFNLQFNQSWTTMPNVIVWPLTFTDSQPTTTAVKYSFFNITATSITLTGFTATVWVDGLTQLSRLGINYQATTNPQLAYRQIQLKAGGSATATAPTFTYGFVYLTYLMGWKLAVKTVITAASSGTTLTLTSSTYNDVSEYFTYQAILVGGDGFDNMTSSFFITYGTSTLTTLPFTKSSTMDPLSGGCPMEYLSYGVFTYSSTATVYPTVDFSFAYTPTTCVAGSFAYSYTVSKSSALAIRINAHTSLLYQAVCVNSTQDPMAGTCKCWTGFYDPGTGQSCLPCSYKCATCSSLTTCLTCTAGTFRTLASGACNCDSGYYDDGFNSICQACNPTCLTCQTSATNCVTCPSGRYLNSNACLLCDYTCATCTGSSTFCQTCAANTFRTIGSNKCNCNSGYYDDGSSAACQICSTNCLTCVNTATTCSSCTIGKFLFGTQCNSCDYKCFTCSGTSDNCLSCTTGSLRTLTNNKCPCNLGYYDDGSSISCKVCMTQCVTCAFGNNCTSCPLGKQLSPSGQCICYNGYYLDNTLTCQACSANCFLCSGTSSTCTACTPGDPFKYLNQQTSTCVCSTGGYYDDSTNTCKSCHYSCEACSNNSSCSSCSSTSFRLASSNSNYCVCNPGYYEIGNYQVCQPCSYQCQSCNGALQNKCTQCDQLKNRTISNGSCICQPGFYDDGSKAQCQPCQGDCVTCISSTACLSCPQNKTVDPQSQTCQCASGFYKDELNICLSCPVGCITCKSANICSSCSILQIRFLNSSTCQCFPGYFDDGQNANCQACDTKCLTCSGSSHNQCLSCDASVNRIANGSSCICKTGFYDDGIICQECPSKCKTCSDVNTCLSCQTWQNRLLGQGWCNCIQNYQELTTSDICQLIQNITCSYRCKTCKNSTSCASCDSALGRNLNPQTHDCSCSTGFYDNGVNQQCLACSSDCLTCSNDLACDSCTLPRTLNSKKKCQCPDKYYDDGLNCQQCTGDCETCTSTTNCLSCVSGLNKVLNQITGKCDCIGGFYKAANGTCVRCSYNCQTCSSEKQCDSCSNLMGRYLNQDNCTCLIGSFDDGIQTQCRSCPSTCFSCDSFTNCLSCNPLIRRQLNQGKCLCSPGYYDDGSKVECQLCISPCVTCTSATSCSSCVQNRDLVGSSCNCKSGYREQQGQCQRTDCSYQCGNCTQEGLCASCEVQSNRLLITSTASCQCKVGFYDDGSNQTCQACSSKCKTCTDQLTCTSCPINRYLSQSSCRCFDGFFDDPVSQSCVQCDQTCVTCSSATVCTKCDSELSRALKLNACACLPGYYDNGSLACQQCSQTCATCSSLSKCLSCVSYQNRQFISSNSTCSCLDGYYSDSITFICRACYYKCSTCNESNTCSSCPNTRIFNATLKLCECVPGTYDNGIDQTCGTCPYQCLTCRGPLENNCLTCPQNNLLSNGRCLCPSGYYDNSVTQNCTVCKSTCLTCVSQNECSSCFDQQYRTFNQVNKSCDCIGGYEDLGILDQCKPKLVVNNTSSVVCQSTCASCSDNKTCDSCYYETHRFLNRDSKQCVCLNGYYENNTLLCASCNSKCAQCNSTQCTACSKYLFRVLNNASCVCADGYYEAGDDQCKGCPFPCATCTSENHCLSCEAGTTWKLTNNSCSCVDGYFKDPVSEICSSCSYRCQQCSDHSKCLSCPLSRTFSNNTCTCSKGYFDDGYNPICQQCSQNCLECFEAKPNQCLKCSDEKVLIGQECVCKDGFYNDDEFKCQPCSSTCNTCATEYECLSCDSDRVLGLKDSVCQCKSRTYETETGSCQNCHYSCEICLGPEIQQCFKCDSTNHRVFDDYFCKCDQHYFDAGQELCQPCLPSCLACEQADSCTECGPLRGGDQCQCLFGYFESNGICQACDHSCDGCSSNSSAGCVSCNSVAGFKYVDGSCTCGQGYFENATQQCQQCDPQCVSCQGQASNCTQFVCYKDCTACYGPLKNQCTSCTQGLALQSNQCVCGTNQFFNSSNQNCQICQLRYSNYYLPRKDNFISKLSQFNCVCDDGYFISNNFDCSFCQQNCFQCINSYECLSCKPQRVLIDKLCVCQDGYFENSENGQCQLCNIQCLTCTGSSAFECLSCSQNKSLVDGVCECNNNNLQIIDSRQCTSTCPDGYFQLAGSQICEKCFSLCSTCDGPTYEDCTGCQDLDQLSVYFVNEPQQQNYVTDQIEIFLGVEAFYCRKGALYTNTIDKNLELSLSLQINNTNVFVENMKTTGGIVTFIIPPQTALPGQTYDLIGQINNSDKVYKAKSRIKFNERTFIPQLSQRNVTIGRSQTLNITLQIYHPDLSQDSQYYVQWVCFDVVRNTPCVDVNGSHLQFNHDNTLTIDGSILQLASFLVYSAYVTDENNNQREDSVYVSVSSSRTQSLPLLYNPFLITQKQNPDSIIYVTQLVQDKLVFTVNLLYQGQTSSVLTFKTQDAQFTLNDFNMDLNPVIEEAQILFSAFDAVGGHLYQTTLPININFPPQDCSMLVLPNSGIEFSTEFSIQVSGCTDVDQPLYFGYDLKIRSEIIPLGFSQSSILNTILTSIFNEGETQNEIQVQIKIQDRLGASIVIYQNITIKPTSIQSISDQLQLDQSILLILLASVRTSNTKQDSLKQQLLKLVMEDQTSNSFELLQIQQIKKYLLEGGSLLKQIDPKIVEQLVTNINSSIIDLQSQLEDYYNSTQTYGSSAQSQQQYDRILSTIDNYGGILSSVIASVNQNTSDSNVNNTLNIIQSLPNLLLIGQRADQDPLVFSQPSFSIQAQLLSNASEYLQGDQTQISNQARILQQSNLFTLKNATYYKNIMQNIGFFPYKSQGTQLKYFTLQLNNQNQKVTKPFRLQFAKLTPNSIYQYACLALVENLWTNQTCKTLQSQGLDYVNCYCKGSGYFTLVEDTRYIFTQKPKKENQSNVESIQAIHLVPMAQVYTHGTFWLFLILTIFTGGLLIYERNKSLKKNDFFEDASGPQGLKRPTSRGEDAVIRNNKDISFRANDEKGGEYSQQEQNRTPYQRQMSIFSEDAPDEVRAQKQQIKQLQRDLANKDPTPEYKVAQKMNQDLKVQVLEDSHISPGNVLQNSPDDSNEHHHHIEYEFQHSRVPQPTKLPPLRNIHLPPLQAKQQAKIVPFVDNELERSFNSPSRRSPDPLIRSQTSKPLAFQAFPQFTEPPYPNQTPFPNETPYPNDTPQGYDQADDKAFITSNKLDQTENNMSIIKPSKITANSDDTKLKLSSILMSQHPITSLVVSNMSRSIRTILFYQGELIAFISTSFTEDNFSFLYIIAISVITSIFQFCVNLIGETCYKSEIKKVKIFFFVEWTVTSLTLFILLMLKYFYWDATQTSANYWTGQYILTFLFIHLILQSIGSAMRHYYQLLKEQYSHRPLVTSQIISDIKFVTDQTQKL